MGHVATKRGAWVWGLAAIGLVLVAASLYHSGFGDSSKPVQSFATVPPVPSASPSSGSPASQSVTPTSKPSMPASPAARSKLLTVPPAQPTQLTISSIGVHARMGKMAGDFDPATNTLEFTPPARIRADLLRAFWWYQRSAPSYPSHGTAFIFGHTCRKAGCVGVFDRLQEVKIGADIRVDTPKGSFTYRVEETDSTPFEKLDYNSVFANVDGRLVVITCKLNADGSRQTDNFIVYATMVSAQPK